MNISGIRPYIDYSKTVNNHEVKKIENQQSPKQVEQVRDLNSQQSFQNLESSANPGRPDPSLTSYDYARKYQPDVVHEMKGSESGLEELDSEQVVSDKHKEQLMKQYQLFVNNGEKMVNKNTFTERPVENFVI